MLSPSMFCFSILPYNNFQLMSESQLPSDRSFVDLGLLLTNQVVNTKTRLKEINPTLIYEWQGQTQYNQISGKGVFKVRNSETNDLIFQCEVRKWKNGVPTGKIKLKKTNFFSNSELVSDCKIKQIQLFQGQSQNLMKHGKGTYNYQEFFSSGKNTKTTILGEWDNDILISGILQNQNGTRRLDLANNVQFIKSSKKILEPQNQVLKKKKNLLEVGGKQNILKQKGSNAKIQFLGAQKNAKNNFLGAFLSK